MKKCLAVLITIILMVAMNGCAGNTATQEPTTTTTTGPVVEQVTDMSYTIELREWSETGEISSVEKEGTYTGQTVDGIPDGEGVFSAVNSAGTKWTYTGPFKNGKFNGYGKQEWEEVEGHQYTEEGMFEDSLFKPDVIDFYRAAAVSIVNSNEMIPKARQFLTDHPDLFPCGSDEAKGQANSLVDGNLDFAHFSKSISIYGDTLAHFTGLFVNEIYEINDFGHHYTELICYDNNFNFIYFILDGTADIFKGDYINVTALPLNMSYYINVDKGQTVALVMAACFVEK